MQAAADSGELYRHGLGMIASENIVSPMVQKIVASDLHGRYAEGLPGKRYYQGCDDFDTIEALGIDLAQQVFGASFANIQSVSGTVSSRDWTASFSKSPLFLVGITMPVFPDGGWRYRIEYSPGVSAGWTVACRKPRLFRNSRIDEAGRRLEFGDASALGRSSSICGTCTILSAQ